MRQDRIEGKEARSEARYPLHAEAVIERTTGERLAARSLNVSGGGMLLDISEPGDLRLGEPVVCALRLYDGKAPQSWGKGHVVRIDASRVAIDFKPQGPRAA